MPLGDTNFQQSEAHELKIRVQLWVNQQAKQLYHVYKLFFSTWSPPACMKQDGYITEDKFASLGSLKKEYYQLFADYLVQFVQAYKQDGMAIYAISPVNGYITEDKFASLGSLKKEYYQLFADYLVQFVQAYKQDGMAIYAISPVNDPNYYENWNSCKWSPGQVSRCLMTKISINLKYR